MGPVTAGDGRFLTISKKSLSLTYGIDWQVSNAERYVRAGTGKAERVNERIDRLALRVLRDRISRLSPEKVRRLVDARPTYGYYSVSPKFLSPPCSPFLPWWFRDVEAEAVTPSHPESSITGVVVHMGCHAFSMVPISDPFPGASGRMRALDIPKLGRYPIAAHEPFPSKWS